MEEQTKEACNVETGTTETSGVQDMRDGGCCRKTCTWLHGWLWSIKSSI